MWLRSTVLLALVACLNIAKAQTAHDHFVRSIEFRMAGNYLGALKAIDEAIRLDSTDAEFYNQKALIQRLSDEDQAALVTLGMAIKCSPEEAYLWNNRGRLLIELDQVEEAIANYDRAFQLALDDSTKYRALGFRGSALMLRGDYQNASEDLLKAYEHDTAYWPVLTELGTAIGQLGDPERALVFLRKANDLLPDDPTILSNIGFQYQNLGLYEKSNAYYNKVLSQNPSSAYSYSNRAYNHLQLGDLDKAFEDIDISIELYPENSWAYRNRALIWLAHGDMENACRDLHTAIRYGYNKRYGPEVDELLRLHCTD